MRFLKCAGLVYGLAASVQAIATLQAKGSKLFTSDGNQFFVKGIAYQLTPDDPLINPTQCELDAKLMRSIGTNSIRVYHVDPSSDHSACMRTFAEAGIYLWLDLDTFNTQIEQSSPYWNQTQLSAFEKVMDEFIAYDNVAGFFVGNEVLTTGDGSVAAPYVKAAARDVKAYRDSKKYRNVLVGYSAADIATLRPMLQNYLACGSDASEAVDFFALNVYEWCGDNTYPGSGYSMLVQNATNYNIPIFISETGCIKPPHRTFQDQAAIFGNEMSAVWSGAIVYEWIQEANGYGLVSYGPFIDPSKNSDAPPDGYPRTGTPTPVQPDFSNLSRQWKTLSPSSIKASAYTPHLTAPPCPDFTTKVWEVSSDQSLPSLGQTYRKSSQTEDEQSSPGGSKTVTGVSSRTSDGSAPSTGSGSNRANMGLGVLAIGLAFL